VWRWRAHLPARDRDADTTEAKFSCGPFLARRALVIERLRRIGLHPSILLALVLMSLWMVAYWRLNGIGGEFYEPSISGVRAFALYLNGRYGDAARAYRQAHRGPVWVDEVEDPTGAFAVAVGDNATGERRARATLATAPAAIEPRVTLAEVALDRGDLAEASRELTTVLAMKRDHVEALYLSAVVHGRAGRAGEAIDALNLALRSGNAGDRRATLFRLLELAGDLERGPTAARPSCLPPATDPISIPRSSPFEPSGAAPSRWWRTSPSWSR